MAEEETEWRNPFRNEEDAFRVLLMILGAAAIVILTTEFIGAWLGVPLALIGIAWGLYMAFGWLRVGLESTDEDDDYGSDEPPAA